MNKKKLKIYGASRASTLARSEMWKSLRNEGANIVSSWIDKTGDCETERLSELWKNIEEEIKSCDRLVLYIETEDFPLKGALIEVGMALAFGKPVFVVNNGVTIEPKTYRPLGSWAEHPSVIFCSDIKKAVGLI